MISLVFSFNFPPGIKTAHALTFNFGQLFQLTTAPSTISLIKKIQFSQNFSQLIVAKKLVNIRFSPKVFRLNLGECEEAVQACEDEFNACVGNLDQFDQAGYELLEKAKIQCQNSCEAPTKSCFGIYEELEDETPAPVSPPPKECTGPQTQSCTTAEGRPGTQTANSCNTTTGEWNFDECKVSVMVEPPTNPCLAKYGPGYRECTTATGAPGEQYASYCDTATEEWVWKECTALPQQCQGTKPSCPTGYTGSYVCENNQWVNQCEPPQSNCPAQEPDWRVCVMSDGRYGREYTDYCNESTGEWVWRPCNVYINLQPTCTSFTYTDWSTCSSGSQSRTILTREPYGCAGGSPVTYQTCCTGEQPSCPDGWSGSYTCSNNYWWNTCVPPGSQQCYRGVIYKNVVENGSTKSYAKCVGLGHYENGVFCLNNTCSALQAWTQFVSEPNFKGYVDTLYSQTIPNSCDPNFQYTQCN